MTNILHKLLLLLLISVPVSASCQPGEINIRFIGNCGLHLSDKKSDLYIDFPYKSGAHNYMEYDESEITNLKPNATFLFTHKHADHYSKKLLKHAKGSNYGPWNVEDIKKIEQSFADFSIEPFKTQHKVFGISFEHYSYLIVWHGKRIFISGDTESADTAATIKNIDWLFAPAWLLMDATERGIKLNTQKVALYHIGQKDNITTSDPNILLLNTTGQVINVPYN